MAKLADRCPLSIIAILALVVPMAAQPNGNSCCSIVSVNVSTATVAAKVNSNGQPFQFTLTNRALTRQLRAGEGVYANFRTKQVSLDGRTVVGTIITIGPAAMGAGPAPIPNPATSNLPLPSRSGSGSGMGTTPPPSSSSGGTPGKAAAASQYPNAAHLPALSNLCRDASGNAISSQGIDLLPALIGAQIVTATAAAPRTSATGVLGRGGSPSQPPGTYVRFVVENCGDTASQTAFVVDVYLNGTRADTIKVGNSLAPRSAMGITSSLANFAAVGTCSAASVRVVVDSQNAVQDSNRANNDQTSQVTPPCPDLAITGVWRHWLDDLHTQFEIRYKVSNLGNAPLLKAVPIHGWGDPTPGIPPDFPVNYEDTLSSLAPGESRKFQIHQAFLKGDSVDLKIAIDPYNTVAESNKANNQASGRY